MQLIVYSYDYATRLFRGEVTLGPSDQSPDGAWHIPGDCTRTAPPGAGQWLWTGKKWEAYTQPPAPPSPPPPVPGAITRRQCARQLLVMSLISADEALAMAATATPPRAVAALISALPVADQVIAKIDFAADSYARGNPLITGLMRAATKTEADIDEFFRAAARI